MTEYIGLFLFIHPVENCLSVNESLKTLLVDSPLFHLILRFKYKIVVTIYYTVSNT